MKYMKLRCNTKYIDIKQLVWISDIYNVKNENIKSVYDTDHQDLQSSNGWVLGKEKDVI